jgi:hypothetical protein
MKNVFFTLVLVSSILMSCGESESEIKAKEEAKCRAEFSKMLYEDSGTKAILNLAENSSRSMEWLSQNNLKNFQDYVNAETTSCADRQAALTEFKNKIMKEVESDTQKMIDDIRAGKK